MLGAACPGDFVGPYACEVVARCGEWWSADGCDSVPFGVYNSDNSVVVSVTAEVVGADVVVSVFEVCDPCVSLYWSVLSGACDGSSRADDSTVIMFYVMSVVSVYPVDWLAMSSAGGYDCGSDRLGPVVVTVLVLLYCTSRPGVVGVWTVVMSVTVFESVLWAVWSVMSDEVTVVVWWAMFGDGAASSLLGVLSPDVPCDHVECGWYPVVVGGPLVEAGITEGAGPRVRLRVTGLGMGWRGRLIGLLL